MSQGSVIIKIDSTASQEISCDASGDQFNSLLWSATDLDASKAHGLYLAHGNKMGLVDVDYLIITAGDGDQKYVPQSLNSRSRAHCHTIEHSHRTFSGMTMTRTLYTQEAGRPTRM